jgi:molybdenum cofactor guanylyltransferase
MSSGFDPSAGMASEKEIISITGAILAGGRSSRMGQPKQDLRLADGRTMIETIAAALDPVCDRVVVVGECDSLDNLRRVSDSRLGHGPLGGIEALLASGIDQNYLICPCDLPLMTADFLSMLAKPSPAPATVVRLRGRVEPESLPARLHFAALPVVHALLNGGQRAVWALIQALPAEVCVISDEWAECLRNINTAAEWSQFRAACGE